MNDVSDWGGLKESDFVTYGTPEYYENEENIKLNLKESGWDSANDLIDAFRSRPHIPNTGSIVKKGL